MLLEPRTLPIASQLPISQVLLKKLLQFSHILQTILPHISPDSRSIFIKSGPEGSPCLVELGRIDVIALELSPLELAHKNPYTTVNLPFFT